MNLEISLVPEVITHIGVFPVTNSFLMTLIVSVFIIVISFIFQRNMRIVPRGLQNIVEIIIEFLLNLVDSVTGNRAQSEKFFPIVGTIFLFVLLSNWIGLLPGMGTVGVEQVHDGEAIIAPFIRSPSADLNVTLMLGFIAVVTAQVMGIQAIGMFNYISKFFVNPFKKPYFVGTFVGLLEALSEFTKIISFSFRLFGNVFAGEVLLSVILALTMFVIPLPFLLLEIFVGFIQALVFAMLTLVFFKMATEPAH